MYAWLNDSIYGEISAYAAAKRGGAHPLDSSQGQTINGLAPYWRLAYESRWDRNSLSVGTYGIVVKMHPGNVDAQGNPLALRGVTDRYRDVAFDTQYQFIGENHIFSLLSTYIDEKQSLDASATNGLASNANNDLKSFKITGEYSYQRTIGGALGFFTTSGSSDATLYPAGDVVGSQTNSPDSRGFVAEVNYLPWLNTKLQLQYVRYEKFNGLANNYDAAGRNAADNDTLYALAWVNF